MRPTAARWCAVVAAAAVVAGGAVGVVRASPGMMMDGEDFTNYVVICGKPPQWTDPMPVIPKTGKGSTGPWGGCNVMGTAIPIPPAAQRHANFSADDWGGCCGCGCASTRAAIDCSYGRSVLCLPDTDWKLACEDDDDPDCLRDCVCACGRVDGSTEPYHCERHVLPPTPPPTPKPTPAPPSLPPSPAPTPFPTETPNPCNYQSQCPLRSDRGTRACPCRDDGDLLTACDDNLVCLNTTRVCVDCTRGHPLCGCKADGTCDAGLECIHSQCMAPSSASAGAEGAKDGACRATPAYPAFRRCNPGLFCGAGDKCEECEQLQGGIGCPCDNGLRCCKRGLTCDLTAGVCRECVNGCDCQPNPCLDADPCETFTCDGCRIQGSAECKWCNNRDHVCVSKGFPCPNGFEPRNDRLCSEPLCYDKDECGGIDMSKGICINENVCSCNRGFMEHPELGCVDRLESDSSGDYYIYGGAAGGAVLCCICIIVALVCGCCVLGGGAAAAGAAANQDGRQGTQLGWWGWGGHHDQGGGGEQGTWDEWQGGTYTDQTAFFQQQQELWGGADGTTDAYGQQQQGGGYDQYGQQGGYDASYGGTIGAGGGGYGDYTQPSADYGGGTYGGGGGGGGGESAQVARPAADFTVNFQDVTRAQAEAALGGAVAGSYLIRPSSKPSCLSLSFKDAATDKVQHLLLAKTEAGWLRESEGEAFPDIRQLLLSFTDIELKLQ